MIEDLYDSGEVGSALILGVSWSCTRCHFNNTRFFDDGGPRAYRDNTVYHFACIHCDKPYRLETGLLTIDIVVKEEEA